MATATLSFSSADRNSVTFSYGGSGWNIPSNGSESLISWGAWGPGELEQSRTGTSTQTVYDTSYGCETKWSWAFTGGNGGTSTSKEGSKTISGFSAGSHPSISGTLSAKRTSKILKRTYKQTQTRTKKEDGTYTSWVAGTKTQVGSGTTTAGSDKDLGTATASFSFYTRPAEFSWSNTPAENAFIDDCLSAIKWNELMDKAVQRYNWKNCQPGSFTSPKTTPQNHVSSGDFVTASVYNAAASLCGVNISVTAATSSNNGTLIYASYFTALSNAVNAS